jgi:dTDP-4-dehydrorhamnose reductase
VLERSQLDLANPVGVGAVVAAYAPDLIVNAAAFTDVEGAESDEASAQTINAHAVRALAETARACRATLIHYSTDYVFDGMKATPYLEDDPTAPLSAYGRSKLGGEQAIRTSGCAHLILRTSWVYAARGRNFMRTILRLATQRPELRIVDDQHGAPTSAHLIAQVTTLMIQALVASSDARQRVDAGTTVHLAASGATTWYGFACEMRELALRLGVPFGARLVPIRADEYPTKARRPQNSRLNLDRLARDWHIVTPAWQSGLRLCMEEFAAAGEAR